MTQIGKRIRARRTELGLYQEQLAARAGVAQADISEWELGKRMPNVLNSRALARALDVSLDELVGWALDAEPAEV